MATPPVSTVSADATDTPTLCRICYGEGETTNPLIRPCNCNGSVAFIHKPCLFQWIQTSLTQRCSLCAAVYNFELNLEPLPDLPELVTRLSTRAHLIFCVEVLFNLLFICLYELGFFGNARFEGTHDERMDRIWFFAGRAVPSLLLGLMFIQLIVLVPAICALKNKRRYWRYACSNRLFTMALSPSWFLVIAYIGLFTSFFNGFAGSMIVIAVCLHTWDIHTNIVRVINYDLLREATQEENEI